MIVCPNCDFENQATHKFCQQCGTPLTQAADTQPLTAGAVTGVIWWGLLHDDQDPDHWDALTLQLRQLAESSTFDSMPAASYLDAQQRYQILEILPLEDPSRPEAEVKVMDSDPGQAPYLDRTAIAIPPTAQLYLTAQATLEAKWHQCLPHLQDAWQQGSQEILLLEDRTEFVRLVDLWRDPEVSQQQIVYWLYEMTELWAALEAVQARASLLSLHNLRLDEDQTICLQRLEAESPTTDLSLADLGHLWQTLFAQSQRTQLGSLAQLLQQLQAGVISDLEQLRSRLVELGNELEPPDATPSAVDESPEESAVANLFEQSTSTAPTRFEPPDLEDNDSEADDTPTVVLPMQLFSLDDAGRTDTGYQRNHNEDTFSIQTQFQKLDTPTGRTLKARGLYILCDGMGGHAGGEVASALAVDTLRQYFQTHWLDLDSNSSTQLPSEATIREAVHLANQAIFDVNQQQTRSGSGRMGTTLVLALVQDTKVAIAHVGDSRIYGLSRRHGLEQITVDHDVGQREIQRGVEPALAYARPDAYQLTQALGPRDENFVNPGVQFLDINEDTLLLLCSDGLSDNDLIETHWRTHIEPLLSSQTNLDQGVNQLISLANQYNGHDNITAIAIRIKVRPNLDKLK